MGSWEITDGSGADSSDPCVDSTVWVMVCGSFVTAGTAGVEVYSSATEPDPLVGITNSGTLSQMIAGRLLNCTDSAIPVISRHVQLPASIDIVRFFTVDLRND